MKQTWKPAHPVDTLTPHPENPRRGNIEAIQESIDAHGFYGAVLVQQSSSRIIAGEHRWRAAQAEGLTKLPVLLIDCDDDEALRIMLADNRTTDLSGYDDTVLDRILSSLADDLTGTGYTDDDAAAIAALAADDVVPSFDPVPDEDQPRLDQRNATMCPECSFEWRVGARGEIEPV